LGCYFRRKRWYSYLWWFFSTIWDEWLCLAVFALVNVFRNGAAQPLHQSTHMACFITLFKSFTHYYKSRVTKGLNMNEPNKNIK
jgi:hypothetical protein